MAVLGAGGYGSGLTVTCNNCLCDAPYYGIFVYDNGGGGNSYGLTNCTLNNVYYLVAGQNYYYYNQGNAVNCVFASGYMNVTGYCTWSGNHNGFYYAGTPFGSSTTNITSNPFQTWNGNNFYLVAGSPYRNFGTTAISSTLLADLQARTTFAPQAGGWLDNDGKPDLGYHYIPVNTMVAGWGGDSYGQCDVPTGITNISMVAAGYGYSLGLLNNGTVVGWGNNNADGWVPTNLVNNVTMIAAGWVHNVALLTNGTVQAWGDDSWGETDVPGDLTNATVISAQELDTIALRSDGTVKVWGDNDFGETAVPAGLSSVTAIAQGAGHELAVSNGFVVAWGLNNQGQCTVPSGLTNVRDVAAGWEHSVALKKDGTVVCWGDNLYGECNVPAGLSNVVAIAAGGYFYRNDPYMGIAWPYSLALKSDGNIVVWGAGDVFNPVEGLSNVISISGGLYHGLAIRTGPLTPVVTLEPTDQYQVTNGTVTFIARGAGLYGVTYQWQYTNVNISGATGLSLTLTNVQLAQQGAYDVVVTDNNGMGSLVSSNANLYVVAPPVINFQTYDSNSYLTNLLVFYSNSVTLGVAASAPGESEGFPLSYQWQFNGANISVTTSNYNFTALNSGTYSVIVSNAAGSVTAVWQVNVIYPGAVILWGSNSNGQLIANSQLTNVISVAAGKAHGVVALDTGIVTNWGSYWTGTNFIPVVSPPPLTNAIAVAAGSRHDLALKSGGTVVAWGRNDFGQTNVPSNVTNVIAISAGGQKSLALLQNGTVVQWGQTNAPIPAGLSNVVAIAAGTNFSLTLLQNSTVVAWGLDNYGQTNVPAGLSNVVAIAAGGAHALALKQNGTVVAWGAWTNVPAGLSNVLNVAAGENHSIALKNDGTVICWGDNTYGQTNVISGLSPVKLIAGGGDFTLVSEFSPTVMYSVDVTKDLLLIYNTNSVDSTTVLNYYLSHRPNVSGANALGLGYSNPVTPGYFETITPTELTNQIFNPTITWLTNNPTKRPQYVILFMDLPDRVNDSSAYPTNGYSDNGDHPSVSVQLRSFVAGWQPYVTHLNMGMTNTVNRTNDCIAYINKLAAIGVPIVSNSPVLSASARGGYGNTNFVLDNVRFNIYPETWGGSGFYISAATNALIADGVSPSAIQFYDAVITNGYTDGNYRVLTYLKNGSSVNVTNAFLTFDATNEVNVAGYVSWGVHGDISGRQTVDGSLTWHGNSGWWLINTEESFNGWQIADLDHGQGSFTVWYSSTAFGGTNYSNTPIGAVTTVDEPTLGGKHDNSGYFGLWARGKNFGICSWNSTVLTSSSTNPPASYQMVGDPFVVR